MCLCKKRNEQRYSMEGEEEEKKNVNRHSLHMIRACSAGGLGGDAGVLACAVRLNEKREEDRDLL